MLGVRLEPELEQRLSQLAEKTKRSKSFLAKEALRDYLDRLETQERRRQETLARWEAYEQSEESVPHEAMEDWLMSWGDDEEKACPTTK